MENKRYKNFKSYSGKFKEEYCVYNLGDIDFLLSNVINKNNETLSTYKELFYYYKETENEKMLNKMQAVFNEYMEIENYKTIDNEYKCKISTKNVPKTIIESINKLSNSIEKEKEF